MRHAQTTKRLFAALFCTLLALAFVAASSLTASASAEPNQSDNSPSEAAAAPETAETLTVGVPADRCPVFYRDAKTGEVTGIGVDLMRSAAENAGYDVTFKVVEEKTLKEALDNSTYDLVMPFGSAITSASGKPTIVSENLIQTPFTLVTTGARHKLPPINDLRVGMLSSLGGGAETVRELHPGIEITFFETMPECVDALRSGKVDALLHNSYVWSYVLQKPSYSDLAVQPAAMFSMDFRAGTTDTPRGQAIIERLNGGISALSDTRRQAITLDHTTRQLYKYDIGDYLYQYGLVILLGLLLFALLVVITIQKRRAIRLEHEEKVRQLIDHDPLTGALSLNGFRKRVEQLLRENPNVPYLLLYNNIKGFKYINDSLGRDAGDELLCHWANTMQKALSDQEAIGRIDGDHFAILRREGGEAQMQNDVELTDSIRRYFENRGKEHRLHICGGVYVLAPEDYQQANVDRMLDFARVAESRVRETRDDGFEFYNPEQWERGKRDTGIVNHLPSAIRSGEIQVWYQPQVDFETGTITGAEALCRWNHAQLGWLSPAEFIPTLERHSLVYELDRFVWETVCQDLRRWNEQGPRRHVSVNLSRSCVQENESIATYFRDLTRRYDIAPDQLGIEITETAYVEDPDLLIRTTRELQELGFQVEMDDFGSGYSSLNMLKEVPVDRIKLDLRFLSGSGDPKKGRIIVSHVIRMVDSLGMRIIAEGVENDAQAQFLQSQGCTEMQGFRFYKPMPVQDFEQLQR